jgi:hypothetical protein
MELIKGEKSHQGELGKTKIVSTNAVLEKRCVVEGSNI